MRGGREKAVGAVVCLCLFSGIGCVGYTRYLRFCAQYCLEKVGRLQIGTTTLQDAERALWPLRRFESLGNFNTHRGELPYYTYLFKNSGLHLLGVYQPTLFQIGLIYRNGILVEKIVSLSQGSPNVTASTRESEVGFLQNAALDRARSGIVVGIYSPPSRMQIIFDERASERDRRDAFRYDLGCFTAVLGCRTVHRLLPTFNAAK